MSGSLPGSVRVWMNQGPSSVRVCFRARVQFFGVLSPEDLQVDGFGEAAQIDDDGLGGDGGGGRVDAVVEQDDDEVLRGEVAGGDC